MPFPSSVIARAISNSETLNYHFVKQDIGSVRGSPNCTIEKFTNGTI